MLNGSWRARVPSPRRFTNIRWRLTLWYLVILAVVLAVFGTLIYQSQARSLRAAQDESLRQQARQLAVGYNPSNGAFDAATSGLDQQKRALTGSPVADGAALGQFPPGTFVLGNIVLLISSDTKITGQMAGVGPVDAARIFAPADLQRLLQLGAPAGPPRASDASFSALVAAGNAAPAKREMYRFYSTPILVKNVVFGTLVVGRPDSAAAQLHRLLLTLLLAAPLTLLIASAGGYWLAARAMRPVRRIAATVREISGSDLSRRVELRTGDELGELAATFDQMLDRLEGAFRRQRQFTSDASHELRTPLTIVRLELARALADPALSPETARALVNVGAENDYMAGLVDDLLLLARADSGRVVLRREMLDLSDLALGVVERLAPLARERGLRLVVGALPELPITGDRVYLTQMLANIVENGIKYTAGWGSRVTIEGGASSHADPHAWVRVGDDGPGIAPEHLPHLFERFYRVDAARVRDDSGTAPRVAATSGTGLGLAIVDWIVHAHDGEVRITSHSGEGTTVEVQLPLEPGADQTGDEHCRPARGAMTSGASLAARAPGDRCL